MKKDIKREAVASRPMTKRQLSRHEREKRIQTIILAASGAVVAIILFILGFGYWREYIRIADEPVAVVGGKEISTRTVAKLIGYYDSFYNNQIIDLQGFITENQQSTDEAVKNKVEAASLLLQQLQSTVSVLDSDAVDKLILGELLHREAAERKLELTQADRDRAMAGMFNPGIDELADRLAANDAGTQIALPAKSDPTAEDLASAAEKKNTVLENQRILTEADFQYYVLEPYAIEKKIQAELYAQVPTKGEQVKARHILFENEQQARENLALIKAGSLDFAEAAKQLSQDPGTKDKGGDLGWFPRGRMDAAFDEAVFALQPGQLSDVVNTSYGYHIIKVEERAPEREIDAANLEYLRGAAYTKWMTEVQQKESNKITYDYSAAKAKWARDNALKPNLRQAAG